jgi:phosphoglucosamine mutase
MTQTPATRKYFGTDGIRGQANKEPMTAASALRVAMAAGYYFKRVVHNHKPKVVIGKDTRLSGYMLENAMTAGFLSMGMDVTLVGPMPTPAIAQLTRSLRADLGVMISASHNPFQDNGIKLFGADGFKLSDAVELEIEALIDSDDLETHLAGPEEIGRAKRVDEEGGRYVEFVKASFPKNATLHGMKIVLDCANGAAYKVAPKVLWELGAEVIALGVDPNGKNINRGCGATDTIAMQDAVLIHGADIGLALDGDADRLIVCDEKGQRIDGDQIIGVIAHQMNKQGLLKKNGVVMNLMSNLGLERFLKANGMHLVRTAVGDRYVMEAMRRDGYNLGGEQSGHFMCLDYGTAGDGLMAGLQVVAALQASGKKASEVLNVFPLVPQILKGVRFKGDNPMETPAIQSYLEQKHKEIEGKGRILVRKSGTESLIRVMAEGDNADEVQRVVDEICEELSKVAA